MTDPFDALRVAYEQGKHDWGYDDGQRDAFAAARRIVAGFLNIDETGDRQCADPACDLCVVAPLIYAALQDLSAEGKT